MPGNKKNLEEVDEESLPVGWAITVELTLESARKQLEEQALVVNGHAYTITGKNLQYLQTLLDEEGIDYEPYMLPTESSPPACDIEA